MKLNLLQLRQVGLVCLSALFFYSCSSDSVEGITDQDDKPDNEVVGKNEIKVLEFAPAFGQFVNQLPEYKEGDTAESMRAKADKVLANGGMISLGGFGGYVVFKFDRTVANKPGQRDIKLLGNAFLNSAEPGIIMVAYDANKNGQPDANEWFEIAGSEYDNPNTVKGYEITYYKPSAELDAQEGNIAEYIRWTDNQGGEGWKAKNSSHKQSYYPMWINAESVTFKGTLLPTNAVNVGGSGMNWQLKAFDYGYADNVENKSDDAAIDIDWAVDQKGNKVKLAGVDFVKVYTATNQEAGWLGETSTEVSGAIDLHSEQISIDTRN